jgi:hypothetical protein
MTAITASGYSVSDARGYPMIPAFDFRAGNFTRAFNSANGVCGDIWTWLWRDDNIVRMETAAYFDKVGVAPLQPRLLADFDPAFIQQDQIKQMIGRMVRQIMEHHGYEWAGSGFKVSPGDLFTTGSKYRKPVN